MTSAVPCPTYDIILLSRRCPSTGLCFAGKVHITNQPMSWLVCWGKSPCYSQRQIGIHSYITRTMVAIYCNYDHDQHGDHSCGLHDERPVMDWSSNSSLGALEKLLDVHCIPRWLLCLCAPKPQDTHCHTAMMPGRPETSCGPVLQGQTRRACFFVLLGSK